MRGCDELLCLTLGEGVDLAEGVEAEGEADLRFEDVANTGEDVLTEESIAEFIIGAGEKAFDCGGGVERVAEDIVVGLRNFAITGEGLRGVDAGDGDTESDCLIVGDFEDDAGVGVLVLPGIARLIEVPGAAHEHVGGEDALGGVIEGRG